MRPHRLMATAKNRRHRTKWLFVSMKEESAMNRKRKEPWAPRFSMAGPASLSLWIFGWQAAPAIVAPSALLGLAGAFALRRILATA
jgi:hypothetical protein